MRRSVIITEILTFCAVCRSYHCACADNKCSGTQRRRWVFPFRYGGPGSGFFPPTSKLPVAQSFAPMAVTAGRCSGGGGGPTVTLCLMCAFGLLLLASGIEQNPGPDTPRTDIPTPCEEPLVTPHRRQTTKSVSDNAGAAPHVNCMQCNRTSPDQPTIKCSICRRSIHLGCLKAGNYLEGQGWRKQEPPQYIGQLFNSPYFKFICHPCVAKPSPILQDDISFTMRSIERKLDILTSSVVGATTDPDTDITTSRQKPSFAETTAKAVVRQIEQSQRLPLQTTHPSPSPSGIANEVCRHIERRQTANSEADDHKSSVVVLGAPFDESKTRIERNRGDTIFVRQLATTLGIDPMQVQRVHRFAKHPGNKRPPVLKVTFMTEAAQDAALSEKSCLREETDLANVYIRPSHPKSTRDHRNVPVLRSITRNIRLRQDSKVRLQLIQRNVRTALHRRRPRGLEYRHPVQRCHLRQMEG